MTDVARLSLLGPVQVERAGVPIDGFESRKALALLCYLAVQAKPVTRSFLADLFWGDKPEARGRANLSRVLHNLNSLLPDCLQADRQSLQFEPAADTWLDLAAFEELTASHEPDSLARAVELYRGDFMAGFYLDDSPEFDTWLLTERERWRQRVAQLLRTLIDYHTQAQQYRPGQEFAARLLELDPWREEAHQQMMRLLALSGQRSAALAQYETCCRILEEELGVEPGEATTTLYQEIRDGTLPKAAQVSETGEEVSPAPPPLSDISALQPSDNLPTQLTPFIGRSQELTEIAARLADPNCRLLTVIGPGGIGKTRLAIEAARAATFVDGVWFIPLAPLSSASLLVSAIADGLGCRLYGADDPKQQLLDYVQQRELLLILDNFEQLLPVAKADNDRELSRGQPDAIGIAAELLQQAPQLKMLITSRQRLKHSAEWSFNLKGLRVPPEGDTSGFESYGAVQLFLQRARQIQSHIGWHPMERVAIARICRLVGGMPLGIELAAAWVDALPCVEIPNEIERNLDFLAATLRDLPERHRSIRAVFDQSWSLLTGQERCLFRRLTVFRGGLTREAAEAVCTSSDQFQAPISILQALSALVGKSFLRHTPDGRYDIHELLRQYGERKLQADPAEAQQTRDRHSEYYLTFLAQQEPRLKGAEQRAALDDITPEIKNIRPAWRWAAEQTKAGLLMQAAEALWIYFVERCRFHEFQELCDQTLARLEEAISSGVGSTPEVELVLGKTLCFRGGCYVRLGGVYDKGKAFFQRGIDLLSRREAEREVGFTQNLLAALVHLQGEYAAERDLLQESLSRARAAGDRWLTAYSLNDLGMVTYLLGDATAAQQLSQESLSIFQALNDWRGLAFAFNNLGVFAHHFGQYAEAEQFFRESLGLRRTNGDLWGVASSLTHLGIIARDQGDYQAARANLLEAIRTAMQVRARPAVLDALVELTPLLLAEGEAEQAHQILYFSLHHPALTKHVREKAEQLLAEIPINLKYWTAAGQQSPEVAGSLETLVETLLDEEQMEESVVPE